MIAKNTPEFVAYIKSLSSKTPIELTCPRCNCIFTKSKKSIVAKFNTFNNRKNIYCSKQCSNAASITIEKVSCLHCSKEFLKHLNQIKKHPNNFCSRSCAAIYNNTHKTTGTRRSKLERWIESQLKILLPDLELLFNKKSAAESEVDIYIPSLKLAFEINGILHYKPIYGDKKLQSILNNDAKKALSCKERNIKLVVIDVSTHTRFTEESSKKYLDIILNHIKGAGYRSCIDT